jgi:hypothetical protein
VIDSETQYKKPLHPRGRSRPPELQRFAMGGLISLGIKQNKEIVRAFAKAINERDWRRLDELVHPSFVRHSYAASPVNNREDLKKYLRCDFEIFPD